MSEDLSRADVATGYTVAAYTAGVRYAVESVRDYLRDCHLPTLSPEALNDWLDLLLAESGADQ